MVSTPYKVQLNPNRYSGHCIWHASNQLARPLQSYYRTANLQEICTLQMSFLRPLLLDLHTDDWNPNFQSVKKVSIMKYTVFCRIIILPKSKKNSKQNNHISFFPSFVLQIENCIFNWLTAKLWPSETLLLIYSKKPFLIDLWSFHVIFLIPPILHILILTAFHPQLPSPIHICQKSLTTHWMIKL